MILTADVLENAFVRPGAVRTVYASGGAVGAGLRPGLMGREW